ncbi:MAG TPA: hypothetical protein VFR31_18130 [Thermoanaerobaculia bacterium]|nr:hypothetical protein [Thermoanaerobaculia bacterium]
MASDPQKIRTLAEQIQSLEPKERLDLLRQALTPEEEFVLFVESLHRKNRSLAPREVDRDIDQAVREVRAQRRLSSASTK